MSATCLDRYRPANVLGMDPQSPKKEKSPNSTVENCLPLNTNGELVSYCDELPTLGNEFRDLIDQMVPMPASLLTFNSNWEPPWSTAAPHPFFPDNSLVASDTRDIQNFGDLPPLRSLEGRRPLVVGSINAECKLAEPLPAKIDFSPDQPVYSCSPVSTPKSRGSTSSTTSSKKTRRRRPSNLVPPLSISPSRLEHPPRLVTTPCKTPKTPRARTPSTPKTPRTPRTPSTPRTPVSRQQSCSPSASSIECPICHRHFEDETALSNHAPAHAFKCDSCDKTFGRGCDLKRHMRIHTGEKPYTCDTCGKSFTQSYTLTLHRRVHSGEKPYHCSYCPKRFNDSTNLRKHERTHTGEKPYECNICHKTFTISSHLRRHERVHEKRNEKQKAAKLNSP